MDARDNKRDIQALVLKVTAKLFRFELELVVLHTGYFQSSVIL